MTNCWDMRERLGPYVDDELSPIEAERIRSHLAECGRCRGDVAAIRELGATIAQESTPDVPPTLWSSIEQRLLKTPTSPSLAVPRHHWYRPWSIAAILAIAVGFGGVMTFTRMNENAAQASTIDFGVILDALPLDPQKAFSRFLTLYGGVEMPPEQARSFARTLDFEIPAMLPGGFQRMNVYGLRFGSSPGVAVRYERSGEFLAAIFHPTVHPEQFGTHQDYPCVIGDHHGHAVEVGEWRLVHVTDPTTCHCILSRLDETELPAVLIAVAPAKSSERTSQHHRH
ncbi:MAG: zf-HC2 domain-containing protein [Phycisphaerae bacterium]|nr:zf-HC2 domain-containing protein [Phycisphaerae bacterium]